MHFCTYVRDTEPILILYKTSYQKSWRAENGFERFPIVLKIDMLLAGTAKVISYEIVFNIYIYIFHVG